MNFFDAALLTEFVDQPRHPFGQGFDIFPDRKIDGVEIREPFAAQPVFKPEPCGTVIKQPMQQDDGVPVWSLAGLSGRLDHPKGLEIRIRENEMNSVTISLAASQSREERSFR